MPDFEHLTDAELVAAFRGGDSAAFAGIYDRYSERLYSYCLTMLRRRSDAADATHDTFVEAATNLDELGEPDKLRLFLFAIARSQTRTESRRRSTVSSPNDPVEMLHDDPDLTERPVQAEMRAMIWKAADSLSERDQQLLALHLIEGMEGDDLAVALGSDPANTGGLVARMRDRVGQALGAMLIVRLGSQDCNELPAVLGDEDGAFDSDVRARVNRHLADCDVCRQRRSVLLAPGAVLPGIMLVSPPDALRSRVMGGILGEDHAAPAQKAPSDLVMWTVFVVLAVTLGLIGVNVGAQFTPMTQDAGPADREVPSADTAPTPTTSAPTTTTTTSSAATTDPTVAGSAAAPSLSVDTATIDFGDDDASGSLDIRNAGQVAASFSVAASSELLILAAAEGEVQPGETIQFAVNLDRDDLPEGDIDETVTVSWEGGESIVPVTGTHIDNPIIHNPQASPSDLVVDGGDACTPTTSTVSARITDTSTFTAVVQWSSDGIGLAETTMTDAGNEIYEAVIGPFATARVADIRIVATDELGNAGGTGITVDVAACP